MLDLEQKAEVEGVVEHSLDKAGRIWEKHGMALDEGLRAVTDSMAKAERVSSRIPGRNQVEEGQEEVGNFIALVADMRDSSKHLLSAIAENPISELRRVFFETSALLPALEQTIRFEGGGVTEYLGDGVLALFAVNEYESAAAIKASFRAAENCIGDTRAIVNAAIKRRYDLPSLKLGVGLAMSKAVVSLVGLEGRSHAKATGRCVYFASKLSKGVNEVVVDKVLRGSWPKTPGGGLRFQSVRRQETDGYLVTRGD
jgi:class 3 adenylate cyclase